MVRFCRNALIITIAIGSPSSSFIVSLPPTYGRLISSPSAMRTQQTQQGWSRPMRHATALRVGETEEENVDPGVGQPTKESAEQSRRVIEKLVNDNKVMLFMKGNKEIPQCGFSTTAVQILQSYDVEFETFDVLTDAGVREQIKEFSSWPTIPQLYVDGEFIGGTDIMIESFQREDLKKILEDANCTFIRPVASRG